MFISGRCCLSLPCDRPGSPCCITSCSFPTWLSCRALKSSLCTHSWSLPLLSVLSSVFFFPCMMGHSPMPVIDTSPFTCHCHSNGSWRLVIISGRAQRSQDTTAIQTGMFFQEKVQLCNHNSLLIVPSLLPPLWACPSALVSVDCHTASCCLSPQTVSLGCPGLHLLLGLCCCVG